MQFVKKKSKAHHRRYDNTYKSTLVNRFTTLNNGEMINKSHSHIEEECSPHSPGFHNIQLHTTLQCVPDPAEPRGPWKAPSPFS